MSESFNVDLTQNVKLSKLLSWILRHGALTEGLPIGADGYIPVNLILTHLKLNGKYNEADIIQVVKADQKGRFTIRISSHSVDIRANQGHSLGVVNELELKPIINAEEFQSVIHGTFLSKWNIIKTEGLHRMNRNHIHFAQNLIDPKSKISGLRKNSEVFIYINLKLALESGLKFFVSVNRVILSPGDSRGYIEPKFFLKVCKVDGTLVKF